MKKIILITLFITTHYVNAQKFLHTEGQKIITAEGQNIVLKGVGLGGHMLQEGYMMKVPFSGQQYVFKAHMEELIGKEATAEFYEKWLANHTQKTDIDSLKSWGFNSVRLPMHYNLYTLPVDQEPVKGKHTWIEKGFQMTDSLLKWCEQNKMYLILDMHATPGGQGHDVNISDRDPSKPSLWESKANQEKLIALWGKLAERYATEPWIGAYDIINEPNWGFTGENKNGLDEKENKPLKQLMVAITEAIRKMDKNHIIIIEGNGWGNNYNGILPPWDDNMVISFHKYWNNNTKEAIQGFLNFREKYNTPIWLGESGENSNTWFTDAISLMQENNIGWCWWPLKKLGSNNPLEIKVNDGYLQILNYWKGESEKPTKEEAYNAFIQLAENAKIENNVFHKGVIDAMIRQTTSKETKPYKTVVINTSGTIKAIDYDMGHLGKAYFDTGAGNYYISTGGERTGWNNGRTYRNDGVDIFKDNPSEEMYVGDIEKGEWLQYTFNVLEKGTYEVSVSFESTSAGKIKIGTEKSQSTTIKVPNTSSWQTTTTTIELQKGENKLKVEFLNDGIQFRELNFKRL
ncbi:cellulase family glycosylhydrolase [Galbibacter mesophilus]|uniref:cellulase family glycosylhydrolase n=1 Tax=Galbibacter mesophilus TaxID=379069 RepID=UPI001920364B|nr:cellulase family glycosylhydrolase [Galbibacter mesophilus]MCM5664024.1 cellulase family glycosylhydrolase [Galbibacter mesophilus]